MNKITILGGSGFLGSALANLFSKNGKIKVIIFDTKKKINFSVIKNLLKVIF